ncbi:RagB/SusD family nutrient uptake outer membrane protein [uncultured Alistipes sp.]|jgi:hypothetical protein|uniref:RagB/SusD family nutrient uptake outer membrane protein n=1 Tax=uncultured Alistipes sp. TaxID=538949 RepID=UPI0025D5A503|nr:RagB/SusD family nutrient uptake outer membrane protein [uncultured Alistipes sp.]
MKSYRIITKLGVVLAAVCFLLPGCALEEEWYSETTPGTFFKTKEDVYKVLNRPFTHLFWYDVGQRPPRRWYLQEMTADQMSMPTRGEDWYDGGHFVRLHNHTWTPDESSISDTWRGSAMGIALTIECRTDLEALDYTSLGLTNADKADHVNQLNALVGYFYLRSLDFFGAFPIFTDLLKPAEGRSKPEKVFAHTEKLLTDAIESLYKKEAGTEASSVISRGAAAVLLARLYFNAESYIGESRYAECKKLCEDLLAGEYGAYKLDETWYGPFSFDNKKSQALIWALPTRNTDEEMFDMFYRYGFHYNMKMVFEGLFQPYNGFGLTPSHAPDNTSYNFKLNGPFSKFNDQDLRKKQYKYLGGGKYEGMLQWGAQYKPDGTPVTCIRAAYSGKPLVLVDYVALMSTLKTGQDPSTLRSSMLDAEEPSLYRLAKYPVAAKADENCWTAYFAMIRLEEVYYMLAECRMREGDTKGAADLINEVRSRAFAGGNDPDPVTKDNLDKYRMVDEWGIEFLGEGRRRTDLIRWGMFLTEEWWDHKASNDATRLVFPVPTTAIAGNNKLAEEPM